MDNVAQPSLDGLSLKEHIAVWKMACLTMLPEEVRQRLQATELESIDSGEMDLHEVVDLVDGLILENAGGPATLSGLMSHDDPRILALQNEDDIPTSPGHYAPRTW